MRPEEFDELIRAKFDQNEFDFNPDNWKKLQFRLDFQPSRRSVAIWWFPLLGMAAVLAAVSVGFATYLKNAVPARRNVAPITAVRRKSTNETTNKAAMHILTAKQSEESLKVIAEHKGNNVNAVNDSIIVVEKDGFIGINRDNALKNFELQKKNEKTRDKPEVIDLAGNSEMVKAQRRKKIITDEGRDKEIAEYRSQTNLKKSTSTIDILGGVNCASRNCASGFTIGTSGKIMISKRVFLEGDLAFAGSSNTQQTASLSENGFSGLFTTSVAARTTDASAQATPSALPYSIKTGNQAFNMYYAQFTPKLGYNLTHRISVGFGPDFQQALQDNRPEAAVLAKYNYLVTPLFDFGFVGKTEFSLTSKVRAAFYYRKGFNNFINPMDKFIDRDYFQVQMKYAVFNHLKSRQ